MAIKRRLKHQALNVMSVDIELEITRLNTRIMVGGIARQQYFKKSFP